MIVASSAEQSREVLGLGRGGRWLAAGGGLASRTLCRRLVGTGSGMALGPTPRGGKSRPAAAIRPTALFLCLLLLFGAAHSCTGCASLFSVDCP